MDSDPLGTTQLSHLPAELIDDICTYLDTSHIHALRQTCRTVKEKSDHQFAVKHFETSQFMITRESLRILIDIAKDKRYGPQIKELQLCIVTFPEEKKSRINGEPETQEEKQEMKAILDSTPGQPQQEEALESIPTLPKEEVKSFWKRLKRNRRRAYGRYQISQAKIRNKAFDMELLVEALRNLPSLESMALVDRLNPDKPPRGARRIQSEIGIWPPTAHRPMSTNYFDRGRIPDTERFVYLNSCSHALALMFGAILKSGIKLKQSLTIHGALYDFALPRSPESRRLHRTMTPARVFSEAQINELKPAFKDLKSLSLRTYNYHQDDLAIIGHERPLDWFSKYNHLFPSVTNVSIRGANLERESHIIKVFSSSDTFPHLSRLNIENLNFNSHDIGNSILNHIATLRYLRIYTCSITQGDYRDVLMGLLDAPAMVELEIDAGTSIEDPSFVFDRRQLYVRGLHVKRLEIIRNTQDGFQEALEKMLDLISPGRLINRGDGWGGRWQEIDVRCVPRSEESGIYLNRPRQNPKN